MASTAENNVLDDKHWIELLEASVEGLIMANKKLLERLSTKQSLVDRLEDQLDCIWEMGQDV